MQILIHKKLLFNISHGVIVIKSKSFVILRFVAFLLFHCAVIPPCRYSASGV